MSPLKWFVSLATHNTGVTGLVGWLLGIGANEEFWKAVPVLLVAFWLRRINKPLDGLFYGALSGLGFAVREGIYFLGLAHGTNEMVRQILLRTTEAPFIHATYTAMSGYFIALAVLSQRRRAALCVLGVTVPAALHGCFDFVGDHVIGIVVAALAYLLLISYIDRSQEMLAQLQRTGAAVNGARTSGPIAMTEASAPADGVGPPAENGITEAAAGAGGGIP
jgi:RsiW-degrading membrane proteinase PrsW (M82 family)